MSEQRCKMCGRPLTGRKWVNWLHGSVCYGKDRAECDHLVLAEAYRKILLERGSDD